ncbi:unnamed protein product [Calicophoron daubneyi]|uniref:G-protein coupled receptors family 1 profile domain-containing protein n=1 Tax=Calicophoron daubneyi TaxID=300641 RepID=A0AAV2U071_CALDB
MFTVHENAVFSTILALIGCLILAMGTCGTLLWVIYLVSWRISRSPNMNRVCAPSSTTTATGGINLTVSKWPVCSMRLSTQIYMLNLTISDLVGLWSDGFRIMYLLFTCVDVRLIGGEISCRIQLLLSYISADLSSWIFACLCVERFYIMLYPTCKYSLNRLYLRTAYMYLGIIYVAVFAANCYIVIPTEDICSDAYANFAITVFKQVFTRLAAPAVVLSSLIGMTVILAKQARSHHSDVRTARRAGNALVPPSPWKTEAFFSAKMMLISGIVFFVSSAVVLMNVLMNSSYAGLYTTRSCDSSGDYINNAVILVYWFAIYFRAYVFMLSSPLTRKNIWAILLILLSPLNRVLNAFFGCGGDGDGNPKGKSAENSTI